MEPKPERRMQTRWQGIETMNSWEQIKFKNLCETLTRRCKDSESGTPRRRKPAMRLKNEVSIKFLEIY
jgi:hypothetical protein